MDISEYSYLWDGSDPNWKLHKSDYVVWEVTCLFNPSGPSKEEMLKIKKIVPELKDKKITEIYKLVGGKSEYKIKEKFSNIQVRSLLEEASNLGIKFKSNTKQIGGYIPVHKNATALLIEDSETKKLVVEKMLQAGVIVEVIHMD